jgi:hypothetical protein
MVFFLQQHHAYDSVRHGFFVVCMHNALPCHDARCTRRLAADQPSHLVLQPLLTA